MLLSGCPPFRGETPVETIRQVLEEEPSRPRMLNPSVHRDLETICMKCLNKEPQRRYGSAEALAEDLDRWLVGEPIQARRSSVWEKTYKKAKRNPVAAALVAVSTLAVLVLVIGGHVFQEQRLRASRQQGQLAKQEGEKQQRLFEKQQRLDKASSRTRGFTFPRRGTLGPG